jgi:Restriction endonuclease
MNPGKDFESLVETLERAIIGSQCARVVAPYKATDRTTGRIREHDVAVIVSLEHHEFVTAIECRDRSRPVGVPQVEGFHQKCQDTGINRGVIVSPKGFCSTALTKAKHLGIACLRLDEAKQFNWINLGAIACLKIFFLEKNCLLIPETNFDSKPSRFRLLDGSGNIMDSPTLDYLVRQEANRIISNGTIQAGEHNLKFNLKVAGATIEALDSSERRQLKHVDVQVRLRIEVNRAPIKLMCYGKEGEEIAIREAAVASLNLSPVSGDLVFLKNPDGSTEVKFVSKPRLLEDSCDHVFRLESGSK